MRGDSAQSSARRWPLMLRLAPLVVLAAAQPWATAGADDAAGHAFFPSASETVAVSIAAVGDVLLHDRLQMQGTSDPDGYRSLWSPMEPWIATADIAYMNLEGPMAEGIAANGRYVADAAYTPDQWVYGGYPLFNYPPIVGLSLAASGFDVVSTANNHAMDRGTAGVIASHEALAALGLSPSGTRVAGDNPLDWVAISDVRGVRVAWLACTHHTNGIPDPEGLVLLCDDPMVPALIGLMAALRLADGVIVTPHWGVEFETTPSAHQRRLARVFADAGAIAVLGSHPHVLQGWERIDGADGRGTLVAYSLGNFVSNQLKYPRAITAILFLGLGFEANGRLAVQAARYLPAHVDRSGADGRHAVVRPSAPDNGNWASKQAWCRTVRLFGAAWLHPAVDGIHLSSPDGGAMPPTEDDFC